MASVPSMIRILAVDDHPLLRKGIAALVNGEPDMKLIAEASNGQEAVEKQKPYSAELKGGRDWIVSGTPPPSGAVLYAHIRKDDGRVTAIEPARE